MGSRGPQVPSPAQITPAPQGRTGFGSGSGAPIRGGATASDGPDVSGVRGQVEPLEQRSGWTLAECMETWDAETHMTRRQWRTICQRLVGHGVAANKD